MNAIKATWKKGHVQLDSPADWPEGRRLVVTEDSIVDVDFMNEAEQTDSAEEIDRWITELEALPGLTMTPEQEAEMLAWRKREKEHNFEAARRELEKEFP